MSDGLCSSYWVLAKHLGRQIATSWRTEVFSSIGVTAIVFVLSWFVGDTGAALAFWIALAANVIWLSLFAVAHIGRIPYLLQAKPGIIDEAKSNHWKFGVVGILSVLAMIGGFGVGATWLYLHLEQRVTIGIGPDGRNKRIVELETENKELRSRLPDERSLKVRSLAAADEFEQFWRKQPKEPVCKQTPTMTPEEQRRVIQPCTDYFNKRTVLYQQVLAPKIMAIVQEFKTKGANVINLENCAALAFCGISITVQLRALSEQLNGQDSLRN
jgi:hypothetical protein